MDIKSRGYFCANGRPDTFNLLYGNFRKGAVNVAKKKVRLEERIVDGISTTGKECTKCGEWKPLDNFRKDKRKSCGRGARCKQCTSVDNKKYYQNNGDVRRNYHKQNREVRLIQMRRYREENKRRSYITQKRWREENRESLSSQKKAYYDRNKMEIRQKGKSIIILKKMNTI